jgi:hypothetical protein
VDNGAPQHSTSLCAGGWNPTMSAGPIGCIERAVLAHKSPSLSLGGDEVGQKKGGHLTSESLPRRGRWASRFGAGVASGCSRSRTATTATSSCTIPAAIGALSQSDPVD